MENIKVILAEPNKRAKVIEIENTVKSFKNLVEGYLEAVIIDSDVMIYCNEEGRLIGKPFNREVCDISFVGNIVIVGYNKHGEEISLTEAQIKKYLKLLG